eukprot:gb/GEZN01000215.1/.p1 GENE.gb/GEZN01000215.1/~~gb/GEZN01000215.1/.p1  ORF type:complete len:1479 (+),score=290.08 gb/GEZN01000215.1/:931-5367(+)
MPSAPPAAAPLPPIVLTAHLGYREPSERMSYSLASVRRELLELFAMPPQTMLLHLSLHKAQWTAILECKDPALDQLSEEEFQTYVQAVLGVLLRPGTSDTVLGTRLKSLVREFQGSPFLCGRVMARLMDMLPRITSAEVEERRKEKAKELEQKLQMLLQRLDKALKTEKDKLKKKYKGKPQRYQEKKQVLKRKHEETVKQRRAVWTEKKQLALQAKFGGSTMETLCEFFLLFLHSAAPSIDAGSVRVLQHYVHCAQRLHFFNTNETTKKLRQIQQVLQAEFSALEPGVPSTAILPVQGDFTQDESTLSLAVLPNVQTLKQNASYFLRQLSPNCISGSYRDLDAYLRTHRELLQADCFTDLHADIQLFQIAMGLRSLDEKSELERIVNAPMYQANPPHRKYFCNFYTELNLVGVALLSMGAATAFCFTFTLFNPNTNLETHTPTGKEPEPQRGIPPDSAPVDWNITKKLQQGVLVGLSFNCFNSVFWGLVAVDDPLMLNNGLTMISFFDDGASFMQTMNHRGGCHGLQMVEHPGLFAADSAVLRCLLTLPTRGVAFEEEFVRARPRQQDNAPSYIRTLPKQTFDEIQATVLEKVVLDETQTLAVKLALSQRVALIQGPPGTGKTYCGLRIVAMLFKMKQQADKLRHARMKNTKGKGSAEGESQPGLDKPAEPEGEVPFSEQIKRQLDQDQDAVSAGDGPILILTYKNHALDQFLTGCLSVTQNLVRVGSRSKSAVMQQYNLKSVAKAKSAKLQMKGRYMAATRVETAQTQLAACVALLNESAPDGHQKGLSPHLRAELTPEVFKRYASPAQRAQFMPLCPDQALAARGKVSVLLESWLPRSQTTNERTDLAAVLRSATSNSLNLPDTDSKEATQQPAAGRTGPRRAYSSANLPNFIQLARASDFLDDGPNSSLSSSSSSMRGGKREHKLAASSEITPEQALKKLGLPTLQPTSYVDQNRAEKALLEKEGEKENVEEAKVVAFVSKTITKIIPFSMPAYVALHLQAAPRSLHDLYHEPNLWSLNAAERAKLARAWLWEALEQRRAKLDQEHQEANRDFAQLREDIYLATLRSCHIVGMTTTGAALHTDLVAGLKPSIVIVEEAAEILESQLLACLHKSTQHLILIGDHKQLQPSIKCFQLELHKNLHISLFERLINNKFPVQTLGFQRRMHPSLAQCVASIYPDLRNHASLAVRQFKVKEGEEEAGQTVSSIPQNLQGLQATKVTDEVPAELLRCQIPGFARNMVFWTHREPEIKSESGFSVINKHEIDMVMFLAHALLSQGISAKRITVLTTYKGQLQHLRKELIQLAVALKQRWGGNEELPIITALTVDMYQGDENDVIILSLVRSNSEGKIGFLNRPNRYCVALSRARHAMYVCGNLDLLIAQNKYWAGLADKLKEAGALLEDFPLRCPLHPTTTMALSCCQPDLISYAWELPWSGVRMAKPHALQECSRTVDRLHFKSSQNVLRHLDSGTRVVVAK